MERSGIPVRFILLLGQAAQSSHAEAQLLAGSDSTCSKSATSSSSQDYFFVMAHRRPAALSSA